MPFPARVIPTRSDIDDCLHNNAVSSILEKVAVSNMIGLLTQMNQLSKFASEVFGDVLKDANRQNDRISECKKRLTSIEEQVPASERRLLEKSPAFFYDNPYTGKEWSRTDELRGLLFRRERASMEVNRRRATAEKPPDISSMDRFAEDKKPCIKKYTDAEFFMNEWLEAERMRTEEQKRKRKEKKEKRKRKKEQRVETKKILKLQKKTYNALDGSQATTKGEEFVEVKNFNNLDGGSQTTEFEARVSQGARNTTPDGDTATKGSSNATNSTGGANTDPPPTVITSSMSVVVTPPDKPSSPKDEIDELDTMDDNNEEHGKTDTVIFNDHKAQASYASVPVEEVAAGQQLSRPGISYDTIPQAAREEENEREILTPEMMAYRSRQQAEERMKRDEDDRKKKEEKQKMSLIPVKGTGLLAQIRDQQTRGNLNKVETIKRQAPADQRSQLLDSIKSKKTLKHVDSSQTVAKPEPKQEEGGIYEILKRRKYMEESEESESGSGWDESE